MKKNITLASVLYAVFSTCCCLLPVPAQNAKIVSWNVQTFFDANTDGTEYSEFIYSKHWNTAAYEARLEKLCGAIKFLNADIYVLEEIENKDVVMDIANKLADYSWNQNRNWKYAFFAKNPGDAIGCAIISRFPLYSSTVHNLDIRTENSSQPNMRPITKTIIQTGGKELVIFTNHWKSKSGGAETSEVWRNWQEKMLARLMQSEIQNNRYVIAAGDFNRDISEFTQAAGQKQNVLLDKSIPVYSPWIYGDGKYAEPGSYYYNAGWERIDHFFVSANIRLSGFSAKTGDWCTEDGVPDKYTVYTGTGFSDHLPIACNIEFE